MFGYTGGFSFYAMRGGADLVHSVDSSARAIEITKENVELNFPGDSRHEAFSEDAFKYLDRSAGKYDLIVLDPPAFAKHKNVLANALKGYKRLNTIGFEQIRSGGILFTFSCSQAVSKEDFRKAIFDHIKFSTYFEGYGLYEDADFSLRALKFGANVINTAAKLNHYHNVSGRPNKYNYGKMVIRNGWYVWRIKYPTPTLNARIKWNATAFLLTIIRLTNVINTNKRKGNVKDAKNLAQIFKYGDPASM